MRRANNPEPLTHEDKFIGINLGADFVAEHEFGIKDIRRMFGMNDKKNGIDRRTATVFPENAILFRKGKKHSVLIADERLASSYTQSYRERLESKEFGKELEKGHLKGFGLDIYEPYRDEDERQTIATSWDGDSFGIMVTADKSDMLEQLYNAMKTKDFSIWTGGGGVFRNAGLVVAIRSLLPKEGLKVMLDADLNKKKLEKADAKTGIKKKLAKAGKRYYCCEASWAEGKKYDTKHKVIYFLNPCEQHKTNFGWVTVEDLEEWCEDKGKIPMTEEQIKERNQRK